MEEFQQGDEVWKGLYEAAQNGRENGLSHEGLQKDGRTSGQLGAEAPHAFQDMAEQFACHQGA